MSKIHKTELEWINMEFDMIKVLKKVGESFVPIISKDRTKKYKMKNDILLVKCKLCSEEFEIQGRSLEYAAKRCRFCSNVRELIGIKKGKLLVTGFHRVKRPDNRSLLVYDCKCDCGADYIATKTTLINGIGASCKNCRSSTKRIIPCIKRDISKYYIALKNSAKQSKRSFNITLEDLQNLVLRQNSKCALTSRLVSFNDGTASIDRIDSSIGYIAGNIQIVHRIVNFMKADIPESEFIQICHEVANNKPI